MSELPRYISDRIGLCEDEIEMLIGSICRDVTSIKGADRFIQARLTEYEIMDRKKLLSDVEVEEYRDWKDVAVRFKRFYYSYERQYFMKIW